MDKKGFAAQAGIGTDTLFRNLRSPVPLGRDTTYYLIAEALGMTVQELDSAWKDVDLPTPAAFTLDALADWFGSLETPRQAEVLHRLQIQFLASSRLAQVPLAALDQAVQEGSHRGRSRRKRGGQSRGHNPGA